MSELVQYVWKKRSREARTAYRLGCGLGSSDAKVRFGPVLATIFANLNLNLKRGSVRFGSELPQVGSGSVWFGSRFEPVHNCQLPIKLYIYRSTNSNYMPSLETQSSNKALKLSSTSSPTVNTSDR
ncbi:hypothetical protein DL93DRAFT_610680 [Clavulina sp. PMI_390]|nr:hypothetical protein DL93DRAFT_610680 [Clavulina sp. PMI_390]